jgi:hypothetical protein
VKVCRNDTEKVRQLHSLREPYSQCDPVSAVSIFSFFARIAALDFFEKRLQQTLSPEERRQLTELATKLRASVEAQTGRKISVDRTAGGLSNAAY